MIRRKNKNPVPSDFDLYRNVDLGNRFEDKIRELVPENDVESS